MICDGFFSEKNDFKNYPRTLKKDLELLKKHNVDLIFLPKKKFADSSFSVDIGKIGNKLCGVDRPGHFSGVALVILKFLNLIQPHFITLGQKDYQQILVIKKLIKDFFFKTKLIIVPTCREKNGVALSSRNRLISDKKKHLTRIITLSSDAVGLKAIVNANKPEGTDLQLYFRTATGDEEIEDKLFTLQPIDTVIPNTNNPTVFNPHTFLIGGQNGSLPAFTKFQLKIVFRSVNSAKVPVLSSIRVIALSV